MQDGDLIERSSLSPDDAVLDVEDNFALNQEVVVEDQRILGEVDGALDGVLNGYEAEFGFTTLDSIKNVWNGGVSDSLQDGEIWLAEQGLLGEGARRAKECNTSTQCRHDDQG